MDCESVRTDEVLLSVGVDEALVGWSVENDGTADEDLRINGANMTLYPVVKDAHWITFTPMAAPWWNPCMLSTVV